MLTVPIRWPNPGGAALKVGSPSRAKFTFAELPRNLKLRIARSKSLGSEPDVPGIITITGSGSSFSNSAPYPPVTCKNSGSVYDYTELKFTILVPSNAQAFAFDFNFMSGEYPVYVGTQFNDKFLAILDSKGFKGLVEGKFDHLPEAAFYMVGTIEEAIEKAQKLAAEAA